MKPDTKNYYVALALSILVVIAWQYFYAGPQMEKARKQQEWARNANANGGANANPGSPNALPPQSMSAPPQGGIVPQTPAVQRDRKDVLAQSQRVAIDTPSLEGSINLTGAKLDDLLLKKYRETVNPGSPNIVLLSPLGAPSAYYAESLLLPQGGADVAVPKPDTVWTKADGDRLTPTTPVTLSWDNGHGLTFKRTFSIDADYMFAISTTVENKSGAAVTLRPLSLVARQGTPKSSGYSVLHEGFIGWIGSTETELNYTGLDKEPGNTKTVDGTGGWAGFTDQYWATALVPNQGQDFEASFSANLIGAKSFQTTVADQPLTIAPNATATTSSHIFAGAKVVSLINHYEQTLGIKQFNLMIDWGYLWFITKPMFRLLEGIYKIVGNFGLAIIGLTLLVKLVFFPLANRSYMSMAKMKAVQPQLAALKEKYPDDKMKQQSEMMAIYKTEKINPIAGCLPMVIQIPVFFALYKVLFVAIEMRQAPFYLWIRDLSQPDPTNLFTGFGLIPWNPTAVPLVGHFLALGILPLIMGVSMFLQMKMNPEPTDPVQKTMFAWMPVIFTFMLGAFPSGLVLYWTTNNTLTIIQQSVIMKRAGVKLELFDNVLAMFGMGPAAKNPTGVPKAANDTKRSSSKAPAE